MTIPDARLRPLRTVTVDGICASREDPDRGDARGGVFVGAGNFERAD